MKKKIITVLTFTSILIVNAQKIEIKDEYALLDGKKILKVEKINSSQYSFFDNDENEIFMYKYNDNETPKYQNDDYIVLNFLQQKLKIETKDTEKSCAGLCMNSRKNMEKLLNWLLKEKVITNEGKFNSDKVSLLYEKYDEKITERTMR